MYGGVLGVNRRQKGGTAGVLHDHRSPVDTRVAGVNGDESAHTTNFVDLEGYIDSPHLPSQCTPHGVDAENLVQNPMMTQDMTDMNCL